MATIRKTNRTDEEIEVDADYCFSQAAQCLTGHEFSPQLNIEAAREWRELGTALAQHG